MHTPLDSGKHARRLTIILLLCCAIIPARAQSGFDDDRVMLEGFYWESYRFGHPDKFPAQGTRGWYQILASDAAAIAAANFDLVWLPPPAYSGDLSAGYNPKQYFRLDNSYGTLDQHRAALVALLQNGVEPIADIVINHRDGTDHWADFKNPDWGTWSICRDDECFSKVGSEVRDTPVAQRGADEESVAEYA